MPIEALLNTCELIGVDPREVIDSAYRRLIEEMGEAVNSPSAGDSRVEDVLSRVQAMSAGRDDLGLAALHDEHKLDGDGDEAA